MTEDRELAERIPAFLERLQKDSQPGRYRLCERGGTAVANTMGLAWSCFALRIHHLLGQWESLPGEKRHAWAAYIQSFQDENEDGAFVDPAEIGWLQQPPTFRQRAQAWFWRRPLPADRATPVVLAETKQAMATLADVGEAARAPFRRFPQTPEAVQSWLEQQDWTRPWGAGGQTAGLVVFLTLEAPRLVGEEAAWALQAICRDFLGGLAHRETGGYFRGARPPEHGELINGAMKVLMSLDWLGVPVHYPEQLMATCLRRPPSPRGCHLVDAVYVLHQCLSGRGAPPAVRDFAAGVERQIHAHRCADGGFSFYVGRAQTNYYGVPVSRGLAEGDVQGTCLLLWALALIRRLADPGDRRWNLIRP